jgi:hypothetical protein
MTEDPFTALTLITGPAIMTNACAILQNGATTRYNLAILQWRDFRASLAAGDEGLALLYVEPQRVVMLAERRIRLQLRGLGLLNAGVALFAVTTVCGLVGTVLVQVFAVPSGPVSLLMMAAGSAALAFMLAATAALFLEGACGRAMVRLHWPASEHPVRRAGPAPA